MIMAAPLPSDLLQLEHETLPLTDRPGGGFLLGCWKADALWPGGPLPGACCCGGRCGCGCCCCLGGPRPWGEEEEEGGPRLALTWAGGLLGPALRWSWGWGEEIKRVDYLNPWEIFLYTPLTSMNTNFLIFHQICQSWCFGRMAPAKKKSAFGWLLVQGKVYDLTSPTFTEKPMWVTCQESYYWRKKGKDYGS